MAGRRSGGAAPARSLSCAAEPEGYGHTAGSEGSGKWGCCRCCDGAGTCCLQCYLVAFQYFCGNETLPFTVIKH